MERKKIGILGGGQLGRMLLEAAHRLNLDVSILDTSEAPAKQLSSKSASVPSGHYDSATDIAQFVQSQAIDLLTVEIEHIDVQALSALPKHIEIHPSIETLAVIQDKFRQKLHLEAHAIPIPEFKEVNSVEDLHRVANDFGYPFMLKSKRMAYDGKGNYLITGTESVSVAFETLQKASNHRGLYAEKWVPFAKELAVMVVRTIEGQCIAYPVVETQQQNNICHLVMAPALVDETTCQGATQIALQAVATFSGAGIFGVEMFYLDNGEMLVNEIAPRPHNSGHYTIEASETSQFENHLRAICRLPLGSPSLKVPCAAMLNVLGAASMESTLQPCRAALEVPGATVHLYGKRTCRPGRKMGHITVVAKTYAELVTRCALLARLPPARPVVGVIMGSDSDLPVMQLAADVLAQAGVPHEITIVSAHRTPARMFHYAQHAHRRGIQVIIAGAGGAAHLPGMVAALTPLPVIGVPIALKYLDGQDSLLSIVQMPRGVPVATVAINNGVNAGLLAIRILGAHIPTYKEWLLEYQAKQEREVLDKASAMESKPI